jgi:drug/metabolite transporter (DMT)-like permease
MDGFNFAILAACCWGISNVLVRIGVHSLSPTTGTWISLLPGSVAILGFVLIFHLDEILALPGLAFIWFALAGFLNFALGRLLNTIGIKLVGVSKAAPLFSTAPLFATVLGVTFLNESITPQLILGTLLVVAGAVLITSEPVKQ